MTTYLTHMPQPYVYGSLAPYRTTRPVTVPPRPDTLEEEMIVNWDMVDNFAEKNNNDPVRTEFALYKAAEKCETMQEATRIGRHAELAREWVG